MMHMNTLLKLVRRLGFAVAWEKVEGPTNKLTFLGIEIDTKAMELRPPQQKLVAFLDLLRDFSQCKHLSLQQLQRFAGKLNWATQVICHGRPYLQIVFDAMHGLKHRSRKYSMSPELSGAMQNWIFLLKTSNGKHLISGVLTLAARHTPIPPQDTYRISTDTNIGLGNIVYQLSIKCLCCQAAQLWATQLNELIIMSLFVFTLSIN